MPILRALLLALLFANLLPGLSLASNLFTIGGGLNSSFTDADDRGGTKFSNRTGFNAGFGFEFSPIPIFAYAAELNIETRGERAQLVFGSNTTNYEINLLYLQIPLLTMLKFPVGPGFLSLFVGPEFGIPLSGDFVTKGPVSSSSRDISDDLRKPEIGLEAGFGAEIPAGPIVLLVRPSYYMAFTDMNKDGGADKSRNLKIKLGLGFPLGR